MSLAAVVCWSIYTVASRPLLRRHSPMTLTGYSMAFGTLVYIPCGLAELKRLDWGAVSAASWVSLAFSATFALYVAYLIWYTSVQRVGNVRTSVFPNLLPLLSMAIAAVWPGERFTPRAFGAWAPSSAAWPSRGWDVPTRLARLRRSGSGNGVLTFA